MINKTLAILVGGQSSRMNYNNKALLKYSFVLKTKKDNTKIKLIVKKMGFAYLAYSLP